MVRLRVKRNVRKGKRTKNPTSKFYQESAFHYEKSVKLKIRQQLETTQSRLKEEGVEVKISELSNLKIHRNSTDRNIRNIFNTKEDVGKQAKFKLHHLKVSEVEQPHISRTIERFIKSDTIEYDSVFLCMMKKILKTNMNLRSKTTIKKLS